MLSFCVDNIVQLSMYWVCLDGLCISHSSSNCNSHLNVWSCFQYRYWSGFTETTTFAIHLTPRLSVISYMWVRYVGDVHWSDRNIYVGKTRCWIIRGVFCAGRCMYTHVQSHLYDGQMWLSTIHFPLYESACCQINIQISSWIVFYCSEWMDGWNGDRME